MYVIPNINTRRKHIYIYIYIYIHPANLIVQIQYMHTYIQIHTHVHAHLVAGLTGLAQADTINNRGVVQFITYDGVFLGEKCFKHSTIGIETRCVEYGILLSVEL